MTDFLENQLAGLLLNGVAVSFPTSGTVYVALFSGATLDTMTSGGTAQGEITGASAYARVAVTSGFSVVAGVATNLAAVQFAAAAADWGVISGVALFDALVSGHALIHGALSGAKTVQTNDVLRFASGQLAISFL